MFQNIQNQIFQNNIKRLKRSDKKNNLKTEKKKKKKKK